MLSLLCLFACADASDAVVFLQNGRSDYAIVYPQEFLTGGDRLNALSELEANIRQNAEGAIALKSDYLAENDSPDELEILIGSTNRPESQAILNTLRVNDFFIGFSEGKLVILGGSDTATASAIRYFNAAFFKKRRRTLALSPDYAIRITGSYAIETLVLFGNPAEDIAICCDASTTQDALMLQAGLRRLSGHTLPIVDTVGDYPFTVEITSEDRDITLTENALILSHGDDTLRSERINALLERLSEEKPLTDTALPACAVGARLSLLSLNLSATGYGEASAANRCLRLETLLEALNYPDLLALQEVSAAWRELLGAPSLAGGSYGVACLNGETSDAQHPILYRKDKLRLIDAQSLSVVEPRLREDTVEASYTRYSYAIFEVTATGERFAVCNTRLDRYRESAQIYALERLFAEIDKLDCPVILAGDYESTKIDAPLLLTTAYRFDDAFRIAEGGDFYEGRTENGAFGSDDALYFKSDFVFVSYGDFRVYTHTVDRRRIEGDYISNHWALYVELALKSYDS